MPRSAGTSQRGGRARWPQRISRVFLLFLVLILVNEGAFVAGLPAFQGAGQFGKYPFGGGALILSAWLAAAVILLALLERQQTRQTWLVVAAVIALLAPGVLSLTLHGASGQGRALALIVTSVGVVVAGASSGPGFLARLAFVGGGLIAWGSLVVGFLTVAGVGGLSALEIDSSDRYRLWLGPLSMMLEPGRFGALEGLAPTRQTLGPAMAMLLVVQVSVLMRSPGVRSRGVAYLAPIGCALALMWSMSRTGLVGAMAGLLLTSVPRGWLRRTAAIAVIAGTSLLVWFIPFATSWTYPVGTRPTDTWNWRRAMWAEYVQDDDFFSMFGIGSDVPPPLGAGHAHNLFVESVVNGGQVGLLGLFFFVIACASVIVAAAPVAGRAALGVWGTFVVVAAMELPITVRHYSIGLGWFIVLLTLAAAATGSERSAGVPEGARVG